MNYREWVQEIQRENKVHQKYRDRAKKVYNKYLDQENEHETKFNIFWSNVQTTKASIFSNTPKPDVRRRFLDADPVAREISEVTERALSYSIDSYNFQRVVGASVDDDLISGLGQVRVRYNPIFRDIPTRIPVDQNVEIDENGDEIQHFTTQEGQEVSEVQQDENGFYTLASQQEKIFEEIKLETVPWDQFIWQPARNWDDVQWCGIIHYLSRQELIDQFQEKAFSIPLNYSSEGYEQSETDKGTHAKVYEIFDKRKREILTLAFGMVEFITKEKDGLELRDFYPFPEPLMSTTASNKLIPIPDFIFYQDQAQELDLITQRIENLTKHLKYRGVYEGSFKKLANLADAKDGKFIALDDFAHNFPNRRFEDVIMTMPIEEVAKVIEMLVRRREEIKQIIYETIGISDILRGQSKASETLGAQEIKKQFAGLRIQIRQDKVNRFIRDIFRLKAEVICEHFSAETLTAMTGVDVTPEMKDIMTNDLLREYNIDVETDSTVLQDSQQEQKNRIEALTAMTNFLQQAIPGIQMGIIPPELAKELMLFGLRGFKGSRQIENMIEGMNANSLQTGQGPAPMGGDGVTDQIPGLSQNLVSNTQQ